MIDAHLTDPPFAAPRWFPEGVTYETVRPIRGEVVRDDPRFSHLILSGSAHSILDDHDFVGPTEIAVRSAHARGAPIFGICYGSQMVVRALLGREHVRHNPAGIEVGWLPTEVLNESGGWFAGLPRPFHTWHSHYDEVLDLPADFTILAKTAKCAIQAWESRSRRLFGTQFHPEMDLDEGNRVFDAERGMLAREGYDADALIARSRDDGARIVIERFLREAW
ncbi:MAG: gamma-glutamyl-gamma-aminobutyrate hydrolase family protein [Candidatus Eisenbacteria bacterium]